MFDEITEISLLYDFYGALLTPRQREVMQFYHEENYSLSEIAEEFGISRQGVHDTLKKAEHLLREYEEKLGLVARLAETQARIEEIDRRLQDVMKDADSSTADRLEDIRKYIDSLDL